MDCCCAPVTLVQPKLTLNVRKSDCRCGSHIALKSTLYETLRSHPGIKCMQMYLGGNVNYSVRDVTPEDKQLSLRYCVETDTTFYIHCPLIANLAKEGPCTQSVAVVSKELDIVSGLPGACVLHIGKVGTIENVAQKINQIQADGHLPRSHFSRVPFHLLLEICAGQGSELGRSWEEVRHLYEALDYTRVGLCVDSQHAFASGMSDFQNHESIVKLFDNANNIAPKGISMIHLNDSTKVFGSQVDRHAPLRKGHIWYHSDEGLQTLIHRSKDYGLDLISETSDPFTDVQIVKEYMENM